MSRGSFCVSIDVELAWGIWDKPSPGYHQRCAELEGRIVDGLATIFDRYELAATWAIVGRLLERDDSVARAGPHGDAIWYAPQVIERVKAARTKQDIGSHSYRHTYFDTATHEAADDELAQSRRVHDAHGLAFTSFVYPRNLVAHIDVLKAHGIRVFRSVDQGWHVAVRQRLGGTAGRAANLLDKIVPVPPVAVQPIDHGGIVELPSSMLFMARDGLRRAVHPLAVLAKAKLGLEATRRNGGVFHLWFHPSNFYWDTQRQLETLEQVVRAAAQLRDRGVLDIRPMSSYAQA